MHPTWLPQWPQSAISGKEQPLWPEARPQIEGRVAKPATQQGVCTHACKGCELWSTRPSGSGGTWGRRLVTGPVAGALIPAGPSSIDQHLPIPTLLLQVLVKGKLAMKSRPYLSQSICRLFAGNSVGSLGKLVVHCSTLVHRVIAGCWWVMEKVFQQRGGWQNYNTLCILFFLTGLDKKGQCAPDFPQPTGNTIA